MLDEERQKNNLDEVEDVFLDEEKSQAEAKDVEQVVADNFEDDENGLVRLGESQALREELKRKELSEQFDSLYGGRTKAEWTKDAQGRVKFVSKTKEQELKEKMKAIEIQGKEDELQNRARLAGLGYINLKGLPIVPEALRLITEEEAKKNKVICFMYKKEKEIRMAAMEKNSKVEEIIRRLKEEREGIEVRLYLTSQVSMQAALKLYDALPRIIEKVNQIEVLESELGEMGRGMEDLKTIEDKISHIPTTQVLSVIIAAATKFEASDVHIEAEEDGIQVRFRIDGVLHDVAKLEREAWAQLISRVKLISKLKINIKDRPQDGSFSVRVGGKPIDFRVSTLPTAFGESVVMRILYHDKIKQMTLDNLGIEEYNRKIIDKEIVKPNGMIVVTGPTGSGKTTTLYAVLSKLNSADTKIITVEDPIEYKIEGINQSEVRKDKEYTFSQALKSIVRQDPDIILVGEIRDKETTEIALNAALTGHLVFTTLHTNNAIAAIPRFISLGAKPYLLSPAINVAMAQRLVRRICEECKKEIDLDGQEKERVKQELEGLPDIHKDKFKIDLKNTKFYKGQGCEKCAKLGYKGQIGIFEIFAITDEVKELILGEQVSEQKLKEIAIKDGMITMTQDGILKAMRGVTSLEEVFRVS